MECVSVQNAFLVSNLNLLCGKWDIFLPRSQEYGSRLCLFMQNENKDSIASPAKHAACVNLPGAGLKGYPHHWLSNRLLGNDKCPKSLWEGVHKGIMEPHTVPRDASSSQRKRRKLILQCSKSIVPHGFSSTTLLASQCHLNIENLSCPGTALEA